MSSQSPVPDRLTRLLAAWRRDVEAEPLAPSLAIAVMRRRATAGPAVTCTVPGRRYGVRVTVASSAGGAHGSAECGETTMADSGRIVRDYGAAW
ncbi:hypothetical protein ACQPXB_21610 [Amycolatopsis sp. CA-161197]|uniref:hypothetical protein n=1 Tax=Amycolatopsis sp. CA-161197 TaxID=3239922 RepID=UPI003D8A498B